MGFLDTLRWRRPRNDIDVMKAALIAGCDKAEREGWLEDMFAQMDEQGYGDVIRREYERAQLGRQGVECLDCFGEGPCAACGTDELPRSGWYDDPEEDGMLRWWSGTEWIGGPMLPENALHTEDPDTVNEDGYTRWIDAA